MQWQEAQPTIDPEGIPWISRNALHLDKGLFWQRLTIVFTTAGTRGLPMSYWTNLRTQIGNSLLPEDWSTHPNVGALVYIAEGDFMVYMSRYPDILNKMVAAQLGSFGGPTTSGEGQRESLVRAAEWLLDTSQDRGLRLDSLAVGTPDGPGGAQVTLEGRYGCGQASLIRGGQKSGPRFRIVI